ncbi:MAG TPA: hypothetical protein VNM15_02560 [Candidatus Binatia bacterium]|nr:hypothetical protein [Candidatus Binatia bacterium]
MKIAGSTRLGAQAGFTFNELLVSMGLIAFALLAHSVGSVGVFRQQTASGNATVAMHLTQDKLEELQARRILSDINVCPGGGDVGIGASGAAPGLFHRCWKISPSALGSRLKEIEVTVTWRDPEVRQVTLSTLAFREP